MTSSRPLSIFDLDRTLTIHGTWSPFLLFAARRRAPWRLAFAPLVVALMASYKARLLSRKQLKQAMQRFMLGSAIDLDTVTDLASAYAEQSLASNIHPDAIASIAAERTAGRRVVIASAAHLFYLEAIAERLGVNDVVGTGIDVARARPHPADRRRELLWRGQAPYARTLACWSGDRTRRRPYPLLFGRPLGPSHLRMGR